MKYALKHPLVSVYVPLIFCFILVRACFTGTADAKPAQAKDITIVIGGRVMNYSELQPGYVSEPVPQAVVASSATGSSEPRIHKKTKHKNTGASHVARNHNHKARTKHRKIHERDNSEQTVVASSSRVFPLVDYNDPDVRPLVLMKYDYWQKRHHTVDVLERISEYEPIINEYTTLFGMDQDLPWGLIAVESAGKRHALSRVRAKGLTQIYKIPRSYFDEVEQILGTDYVDLWEPRHNILTGLVTLKNYTQLKNNDLLLGLVSYNAGPGHKKIRGVSSYRQLRIKKSIKMYAINVMAWTLIRKVERQKGTILPYNEENRQEIEAIADTLPGI